MGGHQVPERGPNDDGYDEDGYDESQRAEILEATRDGPSDGTIITDLDPDLGEDEEDSGEVADDLVMRDDEIGDEEIVDSDDEDDDEDDLQDDFDNDEVDDADLDEELDDGDDVALRP